LKIFFPPEKKKIRKNFTCDRHLTHLHQKVLHVLALISLKLNNLSMWRGRKERFARLPSPYAFSCPIHTLDLEKAHKKPNI